MQRLLMPLVNVKFDEERIEVSECLRIRRVDESDRLRWLNDPRTLRLIDADEIASVTHLIEQDEINDSESMVMMQAPAEEFFTLVALVELFMPERLRAPFVEHQRWLEHDGASYVDEHRESLRKNEVRFATHAKPLANDLLAHWKVLLADDDRNRRLRRALGRYTIARAGYFAEEAILQATIGLECLFSPEDEKNIQNTVAAAVVLWLDGSQGADATVLFESFLAFKTHYKIRSLIVHGKIVPNEGLNEAAKSLVHALRRSILIGLGQGAFGLVPENLLSEFETRAASELSARSIFIGTRK